MAVLTVGTGGTFKTIATAVAASKAGDTVNVEPGLYVNDFIAIGHDLVLAAQGGTAKLVASASPPNGKAIITAGASGIDVLISGLDISGAKVKDGNGAAIRYEGGKLTLKNVTAHGNENGLLAASDPAGAIAITGSNFYKNGNGTGTTHNIYVNNVGTFTVDSSTVTGAVVGHQIKSRAASTTITNNTIGDGEGGNASYEIDLPNGGVATISNNVIQKGPGAQNPAAIAFGAEGNLHPVSSLAVTGNTIVNTFASPSASAIRNFTEAAASVTGNALYGWVNIVNGAGSAMGNTILATDPLAGGLPPPVMVTPVAITPAVVPPAEAPPIPPASVPEVPLPAVPVTVAPAASAPAGQPPAELPPVTIAPVEVLPVISPSAGQPLTETPSLDVQPVESRVNQLLPAIEGDPPVEGVVEVPASPIAPVFIHDVAGNSGPTPVEAPITAAQQDAIVPQDGVIFLPDVLPSLPGPVTEWVQAWPEGGTAIPEIAPGGPAVAVDPRSDGHGTADLVDPWRFS